MNPSKKDMQLLETGLKIVKLSNEVEYLLKEREQLNKTIVDLQTKLNAVREILGSNMALPSTTARK